MNETLVVSTEVAGELTSLIWRPSVLTGASVAAAIAVGALLWAWGPA